MATPHDPPDPVDPTGDPGRAPRAERRRAPCDEPQGLVTLTKKFADAVDGIPLAGREVGDRLCLDQSEAALLIAEGWAEPVGADQRRKSG